jgi:hypothetical protein
MHTVGYLRSWIQIAKPPLIVILALEATVEDSLELAVK